MKNSLNFQKLHTADFLINSSAEPANNDKAFSTFLERAR
jgi:hypothetical protein